MDLVKGIFGGFAPSFIYIVFRILFSGIRYLLNSTNIGLVKCSL